MKLLSSMSSPDYRNIEKTTRKNINYREVVYTIPDKIQLVNMSLNCGENIPWEIHYDTAQFIRVESGTGIAKIKTGRKIQTYDLYDGMSIIIPPGKKHYIENNGTSKLKLYTIYSGHTEHESNKVNKRQPK